MKLNFLPGEHLPGHWSVFLVVGSLRTGNSSEVTVVGKLGRAETGSGEGHWLLPSRGRPGFRGTLWVASRVPSALSTSNS